MFIQIPIMNSYYQYRLQRAHRSLPILVPLKCHSFPGELACGSVTPGGQPALAAQIYQSKGTGLSSSLELIKWGCIRKCQHAEAVW